MVRAVRASQKQVFLRRVTPSGQVRGPLGGCAIPVPCGAGTDVLADPGGSTSRAIIKRFSLVLSAGHCVFGLAKRNDFVLWMTLEA